MSNKTMLGDASGRGAVAGFRVPCPAMQHPYTEAEIDAVVKVMREACGQTQGKYMVEFEQAFCAFTGAKHAFAVNNCTSALKMAAIFCHIQPGDEVIIPTPYWTSYPEAVKLAGGVPVTVFAGADRNFEPSLEAIEAARTERTKAIIVNTPNNPTGAVWKPEAVKAIAQWAIEHHVWVISDEIYEHLNYDGAKTTYIGAAVPEVRSQLLVLNGVAKTYAMPGWRVGWMIAPVDVAKAASKLQGHMTSNVNNISQRAAIEAVSGSLDAVYEMRAAFDKRRQTIVAALNDIEGVNCPTPTGAFYAFADVTALLNKPIGTNKTTFANTSELAAALLDEGHVAAVPGEAFGAPGYLRFSYALADDDLVEGMRRMKRWVED